MEKRRSLKGERRNAKYYSLYAVYVSYAQELIGGDFEEVEDRVEVARFSSNCLAQQYVRKSYLKNPESYPSAFRTPKIFRKKSLLTGARYYEIEAVHEYPVEDPPMDPEL